ncbi:MAG: hypothetical protein PVI28_11475 [Gammaproteobacteria bacterium]|jgi:hypothetical protein
MTLGDAIRELLQCLGTDGDSTIPWEQIRRWPKGALDTFQNAGWLKPGDLADTVECPGCEEYCPMPVEIFAGDDGQGIRAFVACEDRNFGRVKIPPARLQQWHFTQGQLSRWIADTLYLRLSGKRLDGGNLLELGLASGEKRAQMLCLHTAGELALVAGSNRIPLVDAVQFINGALSLDADLIRQLVDTSSTGDARYTPNTARREVRKLETAAIHEQWRKEYRSLKKRRPNRSDVWYSQQIAKMECAYGRSAGTIKKNMK